LATQEEEKGAPARLSKKKANNFREKHFVPPALEREKAAYGLGFVMLSKKNRLNKEKDINYVLRLGRRSSNPLFSASCIFLKGDEKRFGFLVSKKVSNRTTKRNLVKRRMRNVCAKLLFQCRPGISCLFIARPKSLAASYDLLEKEMVKSLSGLGALKSL